MGFASVLKPLQEDFKSAAAEKALRALDRKEVPLENSEKSIKTPPLINDGKFFPRSYLLTFLGGR